MKQLLCISVLLFILLIPQLHAETYEVQTFVNDYAGVLSAEEKANLETILVRIFDTGSAEYAVVIIPSLEGKDIESTSFAMANGVLGDLEKNNGLLLLVAINDRKYRFEVGRGLEPILNDAKVGRIGRTYLQPAFKQEHYGQGIIDASLALEQELGGNSTQEENVSPFAAGGAILVMFFALLLASSPFWIILILVIIIIVAAKKNKTNKYYEAASGASILFGGRGGFGGGGFGGSGGGSFGGGSFGGGGSSGGW